MAEKFPIVTYELEQDGAIAFGLGYLVRTPDGKAWCFPSEETMEKYPRQGEAFSLIASQLKEQPDSGNGRRVYLYRGERRTGAA